MRSNGGRLPDFVRREKFLNGLKRALHFRAGKSSVLAAGNGKELVGHGGFAGRLMRAHSGGGGFGKLRANALFCDFRQIPLRKISSKVVNRLFNMLNERCNDGKKRVRIC